MSNFFLMLFKNLEEMGGNGKDLDNLLNGLPWKEKEKKPDGTITYECEVKDDNTTND